MDYESSDILGSDTLHVRRQAPAKWSGFSKTAFFLALLLAAYVGAVRAWDALLKWREKSYRLSMRRQHGIPDNDHRPFNVAYAAVLRARREEEVANNRVHRVDVDELYAEADRRAAPVESDIRQRNPYRTAEPAWPSSGAITGLPGRFNPLAPDNRYVASSSGLPPSSSHTPNFAERYNPNPAPAAPVVRFADEIHAAGSSRRGSLNNMNNINSSPRKHQKRALEEYDVESDVPENPKKTRVEGDEFIDGDEDAEWLPRQKRGEKRVMREEDLGEEDEGASPPGKRVRGKRARKVNPEPQDVFMASDDDNAEDDMDVDNEEWRESRAAIARGKKRDAGSSFGGEDEAADGNEQAQKPKRKRRTRKSDGLTQVPSRGQKRDRDVDEEGSDGDLAPGTPARNPRKNKKRGKKSKEARDEDEEGSVEEGSISKGRSIGDEWESNGVLYKIGPNGQRLRQALVKKAARRFTMPLDSQHPDRSANLEVCVENWLTEEEYKDYKSRHLLAWQDSPKGTQEPESIPSTPAAVAEAPSTPTPIVPKGKNLLWDSPASPFPVFAPSPAVDKEQLRPKAHFRQSIAADVGMRVNPFDKANALHVGGELAAKTGLRNGRRVVAVRETGVNANGLADSTNSIAAPPLRRTFSKWEKQDLEAKAMMKMREANQTKVKERELKERLDREKKERDAAAAAAAAAPIPTISLTKPPTETPKPPAISFPPPAPTASAPPSSAPPPTLPPPQKTVSFAPPPEKSQPPNLFMPVAPSGAAPTSSIPNPFAKPAAPQVAPTSLNPFASTPSAANPFAPSSSPSGPNAPSSSNAATTASKPSFSFATPAAPGPTAAKPSIFGPTAGAKPSAPAASTNNASGAPSFSFAPPAAAQQQNASNGQTQSGGGSLLSRMGGASGAPAPPPTPATTNPTRAEPAPPTFSFKPTEKQSPFGVPQAQAKPAESAFSFKPAATPATASAFAPAPSQQQQQPAPGAPKFTFAPTKPATPAAPATNSSSLMGALGTSDAKPAQTPGGGAFSFAKPAAPVPERQQTQTAPTFSFNPAGTATGGFGTGFGAGFGAKAPTPTSGAAPSEGEKKPSGSGFSFGGAGGGTSAFGGSAFGGAGNTTSAAAPTSVFGGGAAQPQSAFGGFGGTVKPAEEAPKTTTTAFGAPAAATTNSAPAPAFSFGFGGGNNTTTSTTTPAASPAGNPFGVKPSAFGSSTTPAGSPFGAPSPFGTKPAATAGSVFGAANSPFGTPAAGASSPFGTPGAATPSAFGFGGTQK